MPAMTFDSEGLFAAAGRYDAAASESQSAQATLAGASLDASALGGVPSAAALGGALHEFSTNQAAAAAGTTSALGAFAAKLQHVGGLAGGLIDDTTAAAT